MYEEVGKGVLLSAAVICISLGAERLQGGDVATGITLIILGLILIVTFAYLLEKQAVERALKGRKEER